MLMSVSQLVPGVSGSTIAIILGVYDQMLHAVNEIWRDFRRQAAYLLPIALGAVVGIIGFAKGIQWLLHQFPVALGIFFIGVVLGGAPLMYRKATEIPLDKKNWLFFALGVVIVFLMGLEVDSGAQVMRELTWWNAAYLMIGGVVFAIALILPGISGSFMLLVMGMYSTMIAAAAELNFAILLPIGIGALVGTLLTARLIEWLLRAYTQPAYLLILGFILGSITQIFPGWPTSAGEWFVCACVFAAGYFFVWKTSK
jgi:putative membrane protein